MERRIELLEKKVDTTEKQTKQIAELQVKLAQQLHNLRDELKIVKMMIEEEETKKKEESEEKKKEKKEKKEEKQDNKKVRRRRRKIKKSGMIMISTAKLFQDQQQHPQFHALRPLVNLKKQEIRVLQIFRNSL